MKYDEAIIWGCLLRINAEASHKESADCDILTRHNHFFRKS